MLNHRLVKVASLRLLQILSVVFCLTLTGTSFATTPPSAPKIENGLLTPYPTHLLIGITSWINSPPLTLNSLKGKVVLIEFWTTSCPYCQSTLSHLNEWYQRYHDKGLVIIGIHTPKEDYEKNLTVVKQAVAENNIKYPVAVDNNFETWINYNVDGWPASYLVDKSGDIVYVNYGAANYDITESNIRALLGLKD